jgi:ABC-type nitrate/sulfonate/bicarbonate transport system substrate-binding protein
VVYAKKAFLKENPETIKAFLRAMAKGLDYMNKNPDSAADEVIKRLGFDKKYALRAVQEVMPDFDRAGKIDPRGLDEFWKIEMETGDVKERWKDEQWLDKSLINSAGTWLQ